MTESEYREIDEAIDKAQDSTIPFPVTTEDELAVVGDANKTELNIHDFKITFRVPQKGVYKNYDKEFKDVYITPRQNISVMKAMNALMPFFRKATKDGSVVQYSSEEKIKIFTEFGQETYDAMYDLVASVLHIDEELKDYMTPVSVLDATTKIIRQYPEMVNEADTFFV